MKWTSINLILLTSYILSPLPAYSAPIMEGVAKSYILNKPEKGTDERIAAKSEELTAGQRFWYRVTKSELARQSGKLAWLAPAGFAFWLFTPPAEKLVIAGAKTAMVVGTAFYVGATVNDQTSYQLNIYGSEGEPLGNFPRLPVWQVDEIAKKVHEVWLTTRLRGLPVNPRNLTPNEDKREQLISDLRFMITQHGGLKSAEEMFVWPGVIKSVDEFLQANLDWLQSARFPSRS